MPLAFEEFDVDSASAIRKAGRRNKARLPRLADGPPGAPRRRVVDKGFAGAPQPRRGATQAHNRAQERADMEEQLSAAFGEVIKELTMRVSALTSERDSLLVRLEGLGGTKGGFLTKK